MAGEIELQNRCAAQIDQHLEDAGFREIRVAEQIHIIKDCTFVPERGDFTLFLGHAQADIALYLRANELTDRVEESDRLKLYMNADNEFRIPLVVLEIKRGNITTDAIRSRDIIAREMNQIFPFLGYFFVADEVNNIMPRKIYRAGKHFDSFFLNPDTADEDWIWAEVVEEGVKPHLDKLVNSGVIS